jgi:TRAP-type C4-dicarboxylate transport system substrate-binding protein
MKILAWTLIVVALHPMVPTAQEEKKQKVVKLATLAPSQSPWHMILQDMGEEWKKASGGKLKLVIYTEGMGDEPAMVKRMRIEHLQAAALTGVGLSEIVPEIMALQLPMLLRSDEELDYVRDKIAPRFEAMLRKEHFVVLNWGEAGWCYFFGQTPLLSLDDVKKAKLFCWAGGDGEFAGWKDIGANPVALTPAEMHTALQTGRINAFATTPLAALSFQWFGQAREMSDMKWAPLIGATIITENAWNNFPDDIKGALLAAAARAGERFRSETRKQSTEAIETMKKNKLTVHRAPAEVYPEWEKQARIAWPKLMGSHYSEALVREIEQYRDEYRAKVKEGKAK